MYGRFESGVHPRESMNDLLLASQDHANSLEDHVQHLTKRIVGFKNLISSSAKRLHNASKSKISEAVDNSKPLDARYALHTTLLNMSRACPTLNEHFYVCTLVAWRGP